MKESWAEIERLRARNARHRRHGRINDITDKQVLNHLFDEVFELMKCPDDPDEVADVIAVALHYAQRLGMTLDDLDERVLNKLVERFDGDGG